MARSISAEKLPEGWSYGLLDDFSVRCSGHTPSKSHPEYWNGGIKWISLADSHRLDKGYVFETDNEISLEGVKNSSAEIHPAETVVLSRDAGIGKSGVMAEPMAFSFLPSKNCFEGFLTSLSPSSFISNIPTSLHEPNLFFADLRILNCWNLSPSK